MSKPVKDLLTAARNRIDSADMWGKGPRGRSGPRPLWTCCAAEAIEDTEQESFPLRVEAYGALEKAAGLEKGQIVPWNDDPDRTHAEVLAAFDKAIAECGA